MSTQNVNVARFACNVEWDFFCDFQTPCGNFYFFFYYRQLKRLRKSDELASATTQIKKALFRATLTNLIALIFISSQVALVLNTGLKLVSWYSLCIAPHTVPNLNFLFKYVFKFEFGQNAHCLKISHLIFKILAFSTIFCPIKTDLSGNTVLL